MPLTEQPLSKFFASDIFPGFVIQHRDGTFYEVTETSTFPAHNRTELAVQDPAGKPQKLTYASTELIPVSDKTAARQLGAARAIFLAEAHINRMLDILQDTYDRAAFEEADFDLRNLIDAIRRQQR